MSDTAQLELRIMELEHGIHEAIWGMEFMHGCLTESSYQYAYPQMTLDKIEKLRQLAPPPQLCFHSIFTPGCLSCDHRINEGKRYQ